MHAVMICVSLSLQGHKKEIREREETVVDKDKRIYDLRKKNQELEKFKFVLNYKIQELKRQIMPRKKEIQVCVYICVKACASCVCAYYCCCYCVYVCMVYVCVCLYV